MFVTFHSNAYEDITYFGDIAKQLIKLMGHSGTIPGAISAQDLPDAFSKLQQGLAKIKEHIYESDKEEDEIDIGLAKRAVPLIGMLQASINVKCSILWDA